MHGAMCWYHGIGDVTVAIGSSPADNAQLAIPL